MVARTAICIHSLKRVFCTGEDANLVVLIVIEEVIKMKGKALLEYVFYLGSIVFRLTARSKTESSVLSTCEAHRINCLCNTMIGKSSERIDQSKEEPMAYRWIRNQQSSLQRTQSSIGESNTSITCSIFSYT